MQQSSKTLGIVIFIALVILSGSILAATGNFDNPFRIFTQTSSEGRPQFSREAGAERRVGERSFQGEMRGQDSISWSNIGGVLFNVWFLFAVTAFIVVIQYPFHLITRLMRRRIRPVPTT